MGGVHAFANGAAFTNGVFNTPTPFMFANGAGFSAGVMGEAGDEAVMPLRRGPDGRLGVSMHGGGGDVAAEVRSLRDEVNMLRRDTQAGQVAIATATQRTYKTLDRWNGEGLPAERIAG
jgi:phage-related minor tail protein